MLRPPIKIVCA